MDAQKEYEELVQWIRPQLKANAEKKWSELRKRQRQDIDKALSDQPEEIREAVAKALMGRGKKAPDVMERVEIRQLKTKLDGYLLFNGSPLR
jgi:hypothetical protein